MTFVHLPRDWPRRPLSDPAVAAAVLELVISEADRRRGAVYVLLCRQDDRLAQPCAVTDLERLGVELTRCEVLQPFVAVQEDTEPSGAVLIAVARRHGLGVTDDDLAWRHAAVEACRGRVRLLGVHVVTLEGSVRVPDEPQLAQQAS